MTMRMDGRSSANHPQLALRQGATKLNHEHFYGGILEVQAKKAKEHHVSGTPKDPGLDVKWPCPPADDSFAVLCMIERCAWPHVDV
jgi:hypothetical protein